jgi:hypothetical protein
MAVLLIFPDRAAGLRFILPLMPIFLIYVVKGIEGIGIGLPVKGTRVAVVMGGMILIAYLYQLSVGSWDGATVLGGPQRLDAERVGHYVEHETSEDARFVLIKPRVLALYANREAMACGLLLNADEMEAQFREHGIDYLVLHESESAMLLDYVAVKQPLLVWENSKFKLYAFE